MATEVIMPKAGMAMVEGTVVKWLKKVGDDVKKGEPLLEIMTDKVNMEVESEIDGILLKILVDEGEVIPVLTVIAYIGQEGENISVQKEEANKISTEIMNEKSSQEVMISQDVVIQHEVDERVRATPAARKLARETNLDMHDINGSGPNGRIHKIDVEAYISNQKKENKATPLAKRIAEENNIKMESITGSGHHNKIFKADVLNSMNEQHNDIIAEEKDSIIIPMKGIRKIIAQRMSDSYFMAPTVTLNIDVDMTETKEFRIKVMDMILEETRYKVTYTDILILVVTKALLKFPIINATLISEGIKINKNINMAIAVDVNEGLMVPVIKGTHEMSLTQIVSATKDIIERTKNNKLNPSEMEGSTFTLSNLGMFGITHFTQIINQPNSAILGVNAIIDKVIVVDSQPQVRPIMTLSLTIDHRVIDGAQGAKFLQYIKKLLENPMMLML